MKTLSIIVPVFNEAASVREILRRISGAAAPGWEKQVIVVDDGSTDGSAQAVEEFAAAHALIFLRHAKNLGKGAAVRTGLRRAEGEAVLVQDADLEYDPSDYSALLRAFAAGAPVVYGSRNLAARRRGYLAFTLGGKFITAVTNLVFRSSLTDVNAGYKLFRGDILKNAGIESDGFEFCEEVTAKILRRGISIKEVPVSYAPRTFREGKKIRPRDGLVGLWTIFKYGFGRGRRPR